MPASALTPPERRLLEVIGALDRITETQVLAAYGLRSTDGAPVNRGLQALRRRGWVVTVEPSTAQRRQYPDAHAHQLTPSGRAAWAALVSERGQPVMAVPTRQGVYV
ncbi:hypothetical protein [Deinococcus rufus]|uniref:MarR family transcriptional regulator n=1 Tax=Deinococcus rufus TaxID=2136097 RepID=A0ABV7Z7P2_9DEIO